MSANGSWPSRVMKDTSAPSRAGSDRLVGALAARPQREAGAQDGLAHARRARGAIGGIGDEHAEDDDRLGAPWRYLASGGTTPLRKAKQP